LVDLYEKYDAFITSLVTRTDYPYIGEKKMESLLLSPEEWLDKYKLKITLPFQIFLLPAPKI